MDKATYSIGKAVDWEINFEANVSWVGEDSKARVVEEMTDDGQLYRLEGGNKVNVLFVWRSGPHGRVLS